MGLELWLVAELGLWYRTFVLRLVPFPFTWRSFLMAVCCHDQGVA